MSIETYKAKLNGPATTASKTKASPKPKPKTAAKKKQAAEVQILHPQPILSFSFRLVSRGLSAPSAEESQLLPARRLVS